MTLDPVTRAFAAAGLALLLLNFASASLLLFGGTAWLGVERVTLLLDAGFAILGTAAGLRPAAGLRNGLRGKDGVDRRQF